MKLKYKLWIGFALLFIVVAFFGILSLLFLRQMSSGSEVILKDNYASLKFAREMREVLDENDVPLNGSAIARFEQIITKEENNITEPGEKEAVTNLRSSFESLKNSPLGNQRQAEKEVFRNIRKITDINLKAVDEKSAKAVKSTKNASTYLGFLAAFTFLILFSLIFNIVGFFEEPFNRLKEGLKQVGNKRYAVLQYDREDELGEVYQAFNEMAQKVERLQQEAQEAIETERLKADILLNYFENPVIILNDKKDVISMNPAAKEAFHLESEPIGKGISISPAVDNLIRTVGATKTAAETISVNNIQYQLNKELIVIPSNNISNFREGEISTSGKLTEEIVMLKSVKNLI